MKIIEVTAENYRGLFPPNPTQSPTEAEEAHMARLQALSGAPKAKAARPTAPHFEGTLLHEVIRAEQLQKPPLLRPHATFKAAHVETVHHYEGERVPPSVMTEVIGRGEASIRRCLREWPYGKALRREVSPGSTVDLVEWYWVSEVDSDTLVG